MEQLDQLKTMRNQAAERLEAARAALEVSPDAKLVSSLSNLIEELETSLGITPDAVVSEETLEEAAPEEVPAIEAVEEPNPIMDKIEEAAKKVSESEEAEFSLEESLEAELLSGEDAGIDQPKDA